MRLLHARNFVRKSGYQTSIPRVVKMPTMRDRNIKKLRKMKQRAKMRVKAKMEQLQHEVSTTETSGGDMVEEEAGQLLEDRAIEGGRREGEESMRKRLKRKGEKGVNKKKMKRAKIESKDEDSGEEGGGVEEGGEEGGGEEGEGEEGGGVKGGGEEREEVGDEQEEDEEVEQEGEKTGEQSSSREEKNKQELDRILGRGTYHYIYIAPYLTSLCPYQRLLAGHNSIYICTSETGHLSNSPVTR